jgi:cytochrome P450
METSAAVPHDLPDHVPAELVETFDLWDDEMHGDMFGALERLQQRTKAKGGLVYNPYLKIWWAGGLDLAREIYQTPEIFSSRSLAGGIQQPGAPDISSVLPFPLIPVTLDPPDHEPFKKLLSPLFSIKAMAESRPFLVDTVVSSIEDFADSGQTDIVASLAERVPALAFTRMFGLPAERGPEYVDWNHTLFRGNDEARGDAAMKIIGALSELVQRCLEDPGDDVMSAVVHATVNGEPVDPNDALGIGFLLWMASLDTTTAHLSFQFWHMATHPADQQRVREDPALIPGAVEECLRLYGTVNNGRIVARDTEFHGVQLRAGDKIGWASSAAGRDDEVFEDPDVLDPERTVNRHLAFGAGVHRCLGIHLARLLLGLCMEELHQRIPQYRITEGMEAIPHAGLALGFDSIPISWDPGS